MCLSKLSTWPPGATNISTTRLSQERCGSVNNQRINRDRTAMQLDNASVSLGDEYRTPDNAIRAAGQLLINDGLAEPRYVEAMVEAFRDLGPYIVLAPGIAMPHA